MGAGKTTVVGPILAMLLATAQNLIVEVMHIFSFPVSSYTLDLFTLSCLHIFKL